MLKNVYFYKLLSLSLLGALHNHMVANVFPGISHNDVSGVTSSSLIINADVDSNADITDSKLATIATAGKVANSATTATNSNTNSAIVARDGTGSFAAQTISVVDEVITGNLSLNDSTSATVGNINKSGTRFIHNFGTNNTFVGKSAGNFTMSGTGSNTVIGAGAATGITTGNTNTIIGAGVGTSLTTGSNNIYIDGNALAPSNESNVIRIGNTQTSCFIKGISGVTVIGSAVTVTTGGQLGVVLSSKKFKKSIHSLENESEKIYNLRPVTFFYNDDKDCHTRYGLIAEEVEEVLPELVLKDENGEPYSVSYDMLPILLLKELQKLHKIVEQLQSR